jgi:hypothetical protein
MNPKRTVTEMIESLRGQVDLHREREAFHAQQETFHAEQERHHRSEKERYAGGLAAFTERLAALEAAVTAAQDLLQPSAEALAAAADDSDLGDRPDRRVALARVFDRWPAGESFGASHFTAEVERRFAGQLEGVNVRAVSQYLRRRAAAGRLDEVRAGKAYYEALYKKPW